MQPSAVSIRPERKDRTGRKRGRSFAMFHDTHARDCHSSHGESLFADNAQSAPLGRETLAHQASRG
eukprot:1103454-Rhodomonas_salina.1